MKGRKSTKILDEMVIVFSKQISLALENSVSSQPCP